MLGKHIFRYCRKRYLVPALCRFSVGRRIVQWVRGRARKHHEADVYLISFPRCGRTWLRLILGKAFALHFQLEGADLLKLRRLARSCPRIPLIEVTHDDSEYKSSRELLTSKREYQGKKVILLVRDPRDVVVSNYFGKVKRMTEYTGHLSSFLRRDRDSIDSIIRFYNIWAENRHIPSGFLLVRYEDMQVNTPKEIRRVVDFLGLGEISDDLIQEAVEFARFDNMRDMEARDAFHSFVLRAADRNDPESYKVRAGKVGGFVDHLSARDIEYLNEKMSTQLALFYGYVVAPSDDRVGEAPRSSPTDHRARFQ